MKNAENTVAIPREDSDLKSYVSCNYPQWHVKEYATWKGAKKAVYNGKSRLHDYGLRQVGTIF